MPEYELGKRSRVIKIEGKEVQIPPLVLTVFYGFHGSKMDSDLLIHHFKKAQIFCPEYTNWTGHSRNNYQQLALGNITPQDFLNLEGVSPLSLNYPFIAAQANMIYRSKKPIALIDLRKGEEILTEINKRKPFFIAQQQTLVDSYKQMIEYVKKECEMRLKREQTNLERLSVGIAYSLKDYPELQRRKRLEVLKFFGADHVSFSTLLQKSKLPHTAIYSTSPDTQSFHEKLESKLYENKGELEENLVFQAILESYVAPICSLTVTKIKHTASLLLFINLCVTKIPIERVKEILVQKPEKIFTDIVDELTRFNLLGTNGINLSLLKKIKQTISHKTVKYGNGDTI